MPLPSPDALWTHDYVAVSDDVRLHYVAAGPAGGRPVVLLHGFPDFWYTWRHLLPALAAAGFRAIAPDQRGLTGRTSRRASGITTTSRSSGTWSG